MSAITSATKYQQVLHAAVAALVQAKGQLKPAAAGVASAVPGRMGRALAVQVLSETADLVQQTYKDGQYLVGLAERLLARAAALLDPEVAPAAACLSLKQLPGREGKAWAVEALLGDAERSGLGMLPYKTLLSTDPQQLAAVTKGLEAALIKQHAAPARKQAARLAQAAGDNQAAGTEQLCQQLQGMWLGRDMQGGPDASSKGMAEGCLMDGGSSSTTPAAASAVHGPGELPFLVQALCDAGVLQREEVLAAGSSAAWTVEPPSPADLQVAATALLAACKAAGAVAQLPQLLEQVQGIAWQQPWGQAQGSGSTAAASMDLSRLDEICSSVAEWVLLLAPVVRLLLPTEQAIQLEVMAAALGYGSAGGSEDDSDGASEDTPLLTPHAVSRVLGLLGHVVAPGAPGCSYPGCCNLKGRSEAELPVQVCSKCKGVRYCCREHQAAHWKAGHKEVCLAAQAAVREVCDVAVEDPTRPPRCTAASQARPSLGRVSYLLSAGAQDELMPVPGVGLM